MKYCILLVWLGVCWAEQAGIEGFFWKPITGSFDYTAAIQVRPFGTINPRGQWGVRAYGGLDAGFHLFASGFYYRSISTASSTGPDLRPAFNEGTFQRVDAEVAFTAWSGEVRIHCQPTPWITGFAAGRYAGIEEDQQVTVASGTCEQRLRFIGAGPGMGLISCLCIDECLSIRTQIAGYALIGRRRTSLSVPPRIPSEIAVVPSLSLRVGIHATPTVSFGAIATGVGYSLDYVFQAFKMRLPISESLQQICHDVGFAGPFAQVGIVF